MGASLVIVAVPDENDRVWKVSSEEIPHLTLLYLGDDAAQVPNVDQIVAFVEHAANTMLRRFYLPVDRRGELGADQADVLFFKKNRYDAKAIRDFRAALLQEPNIKKAYDATTQFDGPWQPHLTLGYPAAPAKPQADDQVGTFYDVSFNKIAVWLGDYKGQEFLLKDYWDEIDDTIESIPLDVAMSDIQHSDPPPNTQESIRKNGVDFIEHYGVKGMKWGVHKESGGAPVAVTPTATSRVPAGRFRKTQIKTEGGENHPAHEDAIKVARAQAKLKKSGPSALSNQELRELQDRLNLERSVNQLVSTTSRIGKGRQFVKGFTGFNQEVNNTVNTGYQSTKLAGQFKRPSRA